MGWRTKYYLSSSVIKFGLIYCESIIVCCCLFFFHYYYSFHIVIPDFFLVLELFHSRLTVFFSTAQRLLFDCLLYSSFSSFALCFLVLRYVEFGNACFSYKVSTADVKTSALSNELEQFVTSSSHISIFVYIDGMYVVLLLNGCICICICRLSYAGKQRDIISY